jgi:hypothetical protein
MRIDVGSRRALQDHCPAVASADADADRAVAQSALTQFGGQDQDLASIAGAEGISDGQNAAVTPLTRSDGRQRFYEATRPWDSHSTYLITRLFSDDWKILSLQVTRRREIHLAGDRTAAADAWRAFGLAWANHAKPRDITPWQ